jgi:predicted nucleic acid-binding Zn ribbon protein
MSKRNTPKRTSDTARVGDALKAMLKQFHLEERYEENRLKATWEELMGKPIARRTTRLFVKKKVLYVKLNSAPLRQELNIAKPKMLEIISENFGKDFIEDIRFS